MKKKDALFSMITAKTILECYDIKLEELDKAIEELWEILMEEEK